jgi:hypothetical protein
MGACASDYVNQFPEALIGTRTFFFAIILPLAVDVLNTLLSVLFYTWTLRVPNGKYIFSIPNFNLNSMEEDRQPKE